MCEKGRLTNGKRGIKNVGLVSILIFILGIIAGCTNESSVIAQELFSEKIPIEFEEANGENPLDISVIQDTLRYSGEVESGTYDKKEFEKGVKILTGLYTSDDDQHNDNGTVMADLMGMHIFLKAFLISKNDVYLDAVKELVARRDMLQTEWVDVRTKDMNLQLYAAALLEKLSEMTGENAYLKAGNRMLAALMAHMDLYDSGLGFRKNLIPAEKIEIQFVNPYSQTVLESLAVDSISICDMGGGAEQN